MHEPVQQLLRGAVERVLDALAGADPSLAARTALGPARSREHGDLASNVALILAKPLGLPRASSRTASWPSCGIPTA